MSKLGILRIKIAGEFEDFNKKLDGVSNKLKRFGMVAGAVTAAGLGFAVKSFADFDSAMTNSLSIMTGVSDSMKSKMADAAKKVATQTTFSATQSAEAFYFLASAGLSAEQSLAALPKVANFAQAGAVDLATATELLSDTQSALGLRSADATQNMTNLTRVSDVLSRVSILASGSIEQFAAAMTNQGAGSLRTMGKSVEEGAAILGVFANAGRKGAEAGTLLANTLKGLSRQAIIKKDEFKKLGISVFDAQGNMRNMADIIGQMEGAFGGMSAQQKTATLQQLGFNEESLQGIQILLGQSQTLRQYENDLKGAGGTTDKVAKEQLKSFSAQMKLAWNNVQNQAIAIGGKLVPVISQLAAVLGPVVSALLTFAGILLSPYLLPFVAALGSMALAFKALMIIKEVRLAMAGLNLTMAANPILLTVGAVALLVTGFIMLWTKVEAFRNFWKAVWDGILTVVFGVWNWIKGNWPLLLGILTGPIGLAVVMFARNWDKIKAGVVAVKNFFVNIFNQIVGFVAGVPGRIGALAGAFAGKGKDLGLAFIKALKSGITALGGFAGDVAGAISGAVKSAWNAVARKVNAFIPNSIGWGPFSIDIPDNPIPYAAKGAVAAKGQPFIIGEQGPELFVPATAGTIMSNAKLAQLMAMSRRQSSATLDALGAREPAPRFAAPAASATTVRVVVDVTGTDQDLKNLFRKAIRLEAGGSAETFFRR